MEFTAAYLDLYAQGELSKRIKKAHAILSQCCLCPRNCGVNRLGGELGYCKGGKLAKISSVAPHFGEEAPLVGQRGSGTIFFAHCNLYCIYCQNYDLSWEGRGQEVSAAELASAMLTLQEYGCHNINLVTPTHYVAQILEALPLAIENGLKLPLVYNCGGYESVETIEILAGIIDIYMPDAKYADAQISKQFSGAEDYPQIMLQALLLMHQQVGALQIDKFGIAKRGLLVRHLVLPNNAAGSDQIIPFIAEKISSNTYLNVMAQYRPCYRAEEYPSINRRINSEEFQKATNLARQYGLTRGLEDKTMKAFFLKL